MRNRIELIVIAVLAFIIVGLIAFYGGQTIEVENYKRQLKKARLNELVLNDSIFTISTENELISQKLSYNLETIDDLKYYNLEMFRELDRLEGQIKNIDTYIQTRLSADLKSSLINSEVVASSDTTFSYLFNSKFEDEGLSHTFKLKTFFEYKDNKPRLLSENLELNEINLDISLGTRIDGDSVKVFAVSKSKAVSFNQLNSVSFFREDPLRNIERKKRFGIGLFLGYGINDRLQTGVLLGGGLQYQLLEF